MDAWITPPDAAKLYNVALSTIRRWAREDGWQQHGGRPVRYRWEHVQRSYEKRHTGRVQRHLQSRLTQW